VRLVVCAGIALLVNSCARPRPRVVIAPPPPKPKAVAELRGVWVSDTTRLDWDEATAKLQRAGYNAMFVNFASSGAAFYPGSTVLPVVSSESPASFGRGIELAHRRGLAVHAKQIVMFMFKAPPAFQRQLLKADRVMRGPDLRPIMQSSNTWLCPSQPANRALVAGAVTEMLARFPVDGLQFDYIRFSEQPSCYCPQCRAEFERSAGIRVKHWPSAVLAGPYAARYNEWRKGVITDWVRHLSALARRTRPGVRVSAAAFADLNRAREEGAQDWKLWLETGLVDYVCTMTYRPELREFEALVRKQQAWAPRRNQVVVGIGSWKFDRMSQLVDQITAVRQLGAPGFVLFSYDDCAVRDFLPKFMTGRNDHD
jgi:uncharacterized lipoprotein YddW (UPF0748 family)